MPLGEITRFCPTSFYLRSRSEPLGEQSDRSAPAEGPFSWRKTQRQVNLPQEEKGGTPKQFPRALAFRGTCTAQRPIQHRHCRLSSLVATSSLKCCDPAGTSLSTYALVKNHTGCNTLYQAQDHSLPAGRRPEAWVRMAHPTPHYLLGFLAPYGQSPLNSQKGKDSASKISATFQLLGGFCCTRGHFASIVTAALFSCGSLHERQ